LSKCFGYVSLVLLLISGGVWVYRGIVGPDAIEDPNHPDTRSPAILVTGPNGAEEAVDGILALTASVVSTYVESALELRRSISHHFLAVPIDRADQTRH
jgi:hypothetical protein